MKAAAHSSLSLVWTDLRASLTSPASRPMSGYCPTSARRTASVLISSMVRSACCCAAEEMQRDKIAARSVPSKTQDRTSGEVLPDGRDTGWVLSDRKNMGPEGPAPDCETTAIRKST